MRLVRTLTFALAFTITAGAGSAAFAAGEGGHFHPKGKMPSTFTLELRNGAKAELPFDDKRDFDEAKKGFIAAPPYKKIMADAGHVAWDMESYQWLLSGKEFESIHPSLQRQAILNMGFGLYEVVPGRVYQVRGFDLANITFVKGDTGWIVFDPLTAKETARAALELINEKLGKRPVVGVVYSHSHVDHWAGVRGVADEADAASGKVMIIAPEDFMNAAIAENVFAGTAMSRRSQVQYATLLRAQPVRSRGPVHRQERRLGLGRPDRAEPADLQGLRGDHARRREDGVPEHAGHRGAGRDEHLFPAVQGLLGGGKRDRHDPQHLHAARRSGAQRDQLVEADQRGAVEVRPGGRGDVRLAQLAALGQ